jgi:hypothetical protein
MFRLFKRSEAKFHHGSTKKLFPWVVKNTTFDRCFFIYTTEGLYSPHIPKTQLYEKQNAISRLIDLPIFPWANR